jgi:excisionase family DNA binding protein
MQRGAKPKPESGIADPGSDAMTLQEVADYLDCSYAAVLLLVMRNNLSAFRSSSDRWYVRRSDLQKWMGEWETGPTARVKPPRVAQQRAEPKEGAPGRGRHKRKS